MPKLSPRPDATPTHWCNFLHDYPEHAKRASTNLAELAEDGKRRLNVVPQQPLTLARQSTNTADADIEIPDELRALLRQYRPTPLRRAERLEERLGVNARL